ncbi:MAG: hypothetical protein IT204_09785 [Fimbriimonadaceae bacterium]|nr:hypothetical protein [Fimbriimonadaceae bacterium]
MLLMRFFGPPDLVMIAAVSAQVTVLAYVREPRHKAAVFSLPIPFTTAALALGRPVGPTNVQGLLVLYLYAATVRRLHSDWGWPIVCAIVLGDLLYLVVGASLASLMPDTDLVFWLSCLVTLLWGAWLLYRLPPRQEQAYRSPLPVVLKLPILAGIITGLVLLKNTLGGFMTLFPMVGTIGAYEARHSLWTLTRQFPVVLLTITPLLIACRLTQQQLGLGGAIAVGWLAFAAVFIPLTIADWRRAVQPAA